jgi:hypothetical protein
VDLNIAGGLAFFAGGYAIWRQFGTVDALDAVSWGAVSLVLFQATTLCEILSINRMKSNRLLRWMKRMALLVCLLRDRSEPARN